MRKKSIGQEFIQVEKKCRPDVHEVILHSIFNVRNNIVTILNYLNVH